MRAKLYPILLKRISDKVPVEVNLEESLSQHSYIVALISKKKLVKEGNHAQLNPS